MFARSDSRVMVVSRIRGVEVVLMVVIMRVSRAWSEITWFYTRTEALGARSGRCQSTIPERSRAPMRPVQLATTSASLARDQRGFAGSGARKVATIPP